MTLQVAKMNVEHKYSRYAEGGADEHHQIGLHEARADYWRERKR